MREIIRTGILGAAAFAALTLGAPRDADACNTIPPVDECGKLQVGSTTWYSRSLTTVTTNTTTSGNCGCGFAYSVPGATLQKVVVVNPNGTPTTGFCTGGPNGETNDAFNMGLPGPSWSSWLQALTPGGVVGGQPVYAVAKFDNPSGSLSGGDFAVAQVNFVNGEGTLDPQHQAQAQTDCDNDCAMNPTSFACTVIEAVRDDGGPITPFAFDTPVKACAVTDAAALLGVDFDEESGGGCSASGGRGLASAVLLGLVGLTLVIGRSRRRRA
jgi:hypothetical protein